MDRKFGEAAYEKLAEEILAAEKDVAHGRMMSAPALTCGGKVFAFLTTKAEIGGMGFRVGRDYDFAALPDGTWKHLAPFRTKPPMKDWIVVGPDRTDLWPALAKDALKLMRSR